mgnify:CR=1 FL=1
MKNARKLFKWLKPSFYLFLIVSLLSVLLPFTYSYVPQFIKYVFDHVLSNTDAPNTLPMFVQNFFAQYAGLKCVIIISLVLFIFQLVRGIFIFINGCIKGRLSENIAFDMRNKLYRHIQNLSYSYHNTVDTGDLIQRCTSDIDTIKSFISRQLPELFYIFASLIIGAIQMASINLSIMLVTLICLPITVGAGFIFFRVVNKRFEVVEEFESDMTSVLQEGVNGVRVVKAFAREKYEIDKFSKRSTKFRDENYKLSKTMALYWGFSDCFVSLQYAATIGFCIYLAKSGLSAGDMIACISYISMLVYPIRNLGRIISDFGKSTVAARRIDEVLKIDDEYVINGTEKPEITGNIKFQNVTFKFSDSDKYLFDDVSFEVKSGETIAIVGKTGTGKSTLANILVRMLEYSDGTILIDDVNLKDIDKHWLREHIGIILQDPFLYQKSIYENIAIACKNVSKDKVFNAAQIASIHDDILSFDEGYDTLVGEKGVTLSGGQKQRVAISRMLILNKPIIIFDDSLSAVDTRTDLQIRNALKLREEKLTSIIITHRITTAKEADKIIVLENGKISNIGTHEELSKVEGLYKSLWDIQGALEDAFLLKDGDQNGEK